MRLRAPWFLKAALLLPLIWCCSTSRSSESETKLNQQVDEGAWTRETWEYRDGSTSVVAPPAAGSFGGAPRLAAAKCLECGPGAGFTAAAPQAQGPLILHSIEKHEPTTTSTGLATASESESKARFGFSPWQWALGALMGLAGLYGLWKLKSKLSL